MATLNLLAAHVPIIIQPATRNIPIDWTGSPDVSGTWVARVTASEKAAANHVAELTVDDTDAATGSLILEFNSAALAALIPAHEELVELWWEMTVDGVPKFRGPFTIYAAPSQ